MAALKVGDRHFLRIEVCIFLGDSFTEHVRQLWAIVRGRARPVREIRVLDAHRQITIRTPERAIPVHGKGESLGRRRSRLKSSRGREGDHPSLNGLDMLNTLQHKGSEELSCWPLDHFR